MPNVVPSQYFPSQPPGIDPGVWNILHQLFDRVNWLLGPGRAEGTGLQQAQQSIEKGLQVALQAVSDAQTQLGTFVSAQNTQPIGAGSSINGAGVGYSFTSTGGGTVVMSVASASTARSAISAAARANPALTPATITLAKITGGGANGSITVNAEGIITAYVQPT